MKKILDEILQLENFNYTMISSRNLNRKYFNVTKVLYILGI